MLGGHWRGGAPRMMSVKPKSAVQPPRPIVPTAGLRWRAGRWPRPASSARGPANAPRGHGILSGACTSRPVSVRSGDRRRGKPLRCKPSTAQVAAFHHWPGALGIAVRHSEHWRVARLAAGRRAGVGGLAVWLPPASTRPPASRAAGCSSHIGARKSSVPWGSASRRHTTVRVSPRRRSISLGGRSMRNTPTRGVLLM